MTAAIRVKQCSSSLSRALLCRAQSSMQAQVPVQSCICRSPLSLHAFLPLCCPPPVCTKGVRPLVMPVDAHGRALKTLHSSRDDSSDAGSGSDEEGEGLFTMSSFTPQSATDGNSVATQLEAVRKMDPELDGTGQLVCIIDTGISFVG